MPLISVVILTYNQEQMILDCLNSLLQSKTNDVELVVSDDCSRDNTYGVVLQWIKKYNEKFERVYTQRHEINQGTVKNLALAINRSTGDYIKSIGGDDWFAPGAINIMREFIKLNNFDVAFSRLQLANQDISGNVAISEVVLPTSKESDFFISNSRKQFRYLCKRNCLFAPASLYNRKFWETINLNKTKVVILEDWAMWLLGAINNMQFAEIPQTLVIYRNHAGSVSNEIGPRKIQEMRDVVWVLRNICMSKPEWLTLKEKMRIRVISTMIYFVSLLPLKMISFIDKVRKKVKDKHKDY